MTIKEINWDYIWGLFEADGSFSIIFSTDNSMSYGCKVCPEMQITQNNKMLLNQIKQTFKSANIISRIKTYKKTRTNRAPCLVVEGINNIRLVLNRFKRSGCNFYSLKQIDYQIMLSLYKIIDNKQHNTEIGRKKIIDLKYLMHQPPKLPNYVINDFKAYLPNTKIKFVCKDDVNTHIQIPLANRKERITLEKKHNFSIKSTEKASMDIIHFIYDAYFDKIISVIQMLRKEKNEKIKTQNLFNLKPAYVAGLLDGDGCISIQGKRCRVELSFELGSELIYLVIGSYFGDYKPNVYQFKGKNGTSIYFERKSTLKQVVEVLNSDMFEIKGPKFKQLLESLK